MNRRQGASGSDVKGASSSGRLLTPSKITAWLDCAHYLSLKHQVEEGSLTVDTSPLGAMARLLMDKGETHERDCLAEYRRQGLSVLEIPARLRGESFADWVLRVGDPFDEGYDVIFQMPFIHSGIRGIADFLIRVMDPATGAVGYEPVDAKLARTAAKPGHVLQLCFYAEALQEATGLPCENIHIWLGSGRIETLRTDDFLAYWNRLRHQLALVLDAEPDDAETTPEPCDHCDFCEFAEVCDATWRSSDSLLYVAGIRAIDRKALAQPGVTTLAQLATVNGSVDGLRPERLKQIVDQATLQVRARSNASSIPPFEPIAAVDDPVWGKGFEQLPEPDHGDVFLDYEGHPFWRADAGLFFLLGFISKDQNGDWEYRTFWAHDLAEEAAAARALIEYLGKRRSDFPGMHVYHYNHTERSSLERMAADHGVGEAELATLVETGLFVDLLTVARNAVQVGTESYGLKHLEQLTDFERGHEIDAGAGAVVEYESFMTTHDTGSLDRIAAYNEDDVRATLALRDWLVEQRPGDLPWRTAAFAPEEGKEDLEARVAALYKFAPDTPEHLLGHLLGYWLREHRAFIAPKLAALENATDQLLDAADMIAGLTPAGLKERIGKKGKTLVPAMVFTLPEQAIDAGFDKPNANVIFTEPIGPPAYASVERLDRDAGELHLLWNEAARERGTTPASVALNDWVAPKPKPESLAALADRVLDPGAHGTPKPVSLALLGRRLPAFTPGHGPPDGAFSDELDSILSWVEHLDNSYVAIQGPPGTGKTYRGARVVHALVKAGKRVGITAMSHHAIDNLLEEVIEVFNQHGDLSELSAVRRGSEPDAGPLPSVSYASSNPPCTKDGVNLVAGTTWLFSGNDMASAPVDVLIVDEAGQLALADALAASRSAHNMLLLGDPLQLAQVSQGSHPGGGGDSVLEHVLAGRATISADCGVFLSETRRMHPKVCEFISEQIYEGRLWTHSSCENQDTDFGTGLRWLQAAHVGRSTESPEEAEIVAQQIERMIGTPWTDKAGKEGHLGADDFMVVAPYNDQVAIIRERLDSAALTRDVRVGTVDKFQGREAPVVFFTMTSSGASDIKRGPDFLFSRNRLNVAVSRARCLAYLVCTEELLDTRARDVEGMKLLSTLCAFVEYCDR